MSPSASMTAADVAGYPSAGVGYSAPHHSQWVSGSAACSAAAGVGGSPQDAQGAAAPDVVVGSVVIATSLGWSGPAVTTAPRW